MLTRAICQPTPSARSSLQTTAMAHIALRPTRASLLKAGHRQQIRNFRFGMWSSYLDPEFQRELRHRHRTAKHKYAEALDRRLSWEHRAPNGHPKALLKYMLRRYWNPTQVRCGSRFVDRDGLKYHEKHSQDAPDTTHWHERTLGAYYRWMGGYNNIDPSDDSIKSPLDKDMHHWAETASKDAAQAGFHPHSTKPESAKAKPNKKHEYVDSFSSTDDYVIDPITNRKVPRNSNGPIEGTIPTSTDSFKDYRAQFTTLKPPKDEGSPGPIHSNGPPPPTELKEYGQVTIDQVLSHGVDGNGHDGISTTGDNVESPRRPIIQSEEYALNHLPPEESAEQVPEPTKKYEDLDEYKTYGARDAENDGTEVPQNHDELRKYNPYMHNESTKSENPVPRYDDLGKYGPYKYKEDAIKDDSTPKYDDLDDYKHYKDDAGKPVDDAASKYEDLNKYNAANFQDSVVEKQPFQEYGDLEKYRAFKHRELDGNYALERDIVAESLKEFDAKEQESNSIESPKLTFADRLKKLDLDDTLSTKTSDLFTPTVSEPLRDRTSTLKTHNREDLERYMASHSEASDAVDREASSSIKKSRTKARDEESQTSERKLTGHYVRDFPEDFSGSWGPRASRLDLEPGTGSELQVPNEQIAHIQAAEKQYADQLSNVVLEPSLDRQQTESKLEPALNRQETGALADTSNNQSVPQAEADPYSKEPQGLEVSYTKECDGEPAFAKTYGSEPGDEVPESSSKTDAPQGVFHLQSLYYRDPEIDGRPPTSSFGSDFKIEASQATEPTVYKILAYDPTMQKINIAETTSIVPDHASPLTPAEVLLRLSNPTKFFPHFAPLQAEGFEIVSGSGDVLVFRQVRARNVVNEETGVPVNPIDMMGKSTALPNAAAFVSPTGFVNYDVPRVEEEAQTTPFRSNIDVRREEPVFSGPKSPTREETQKRKKNNLGRRALVGGAWVAGISYALGVVSEYFLTGGSDGRGPTGF
ncbi:hypothetical protein F4804DRAFT_308604 [Jackrogersella minutella]|nr:hypothetical protein F4804DRAFT_308604 [Jackrogersella minutella]